MHGLDTLDGIALSWGVALFFDIISALTIPGIIYCLCRLKETDYNNAQLGILHSLYVSSIAIALINIRCLLPNGVSFF
jgi:hypothetical protein